MLKLPVKMSIKICANSYHWSVFHSWGWPLPKYHLTCWIQQFADWLIFALVLCKYCNEADPLVYYIIQPVSLCSLFSYRTDTHCLFGIFVSYVVMYHWILQPGQVKMPEPFGVPSYSGLPSSGGYPVCKMHSDSSVNMWSDEFKQSLVMELSNISNW